MKRLLDMLVAALGLLLLAPVLVAVGLLVKLTSPGPILFRQERIGRHFRPFLICKFRTMVEDAPQRGGQVTCSHDPRITPVGRLLRKLKIDELPQLLNVLKGEMSLVGPRPEVRRYVELFRDDYQEILEVRPGITDLASIAFRDEAEILSRMSDPEDAYVRRVLPAKIRLAKQYVARSSLRLDLTILGKTMLLLAWDRIGRPTATDSGKLASHD